MQDLVDVLPEIVKAAAGVPLVFHLQITLGDGESVDAKVVESVNTLLGEVASDLTVKS